MAICTKFGGYPVTSGQVCDSFERGTPGSEGMKQVNATRPHNLHKSEGKNKCQDCVYFRVEKNGEDGAKFALSQPSKR